MAQFTVTPELLRTKANELRDYNAQFKSSTGNLEATENALCGMWEGEAKNTFHQAFSNDKIQMDNFYNAIENYVVTLENIATQYSNAEARNIEIASTRNYK